jgi:hypothetical protein
VALVAGAAGDNRLVASIRSGGPHEAADELHVLVVPCGLQPDDTQDATDNAGRPSEGLQLRPRDAVGGGSHCDFYYFAGSRRQKGGMDVQGQPQLLLSDNIHFNFFYGKTRTTCKNRTGTKKDLFVFYGFLCFLFFLFLVYGRISSFYVFIGGGGPP